MSKGMPFSLNLTMMTFLFVTSVSSAAEIERVSLSSTSTQSNMQSTLPVLSGDGQLIAFESQANNLIDNDVNQNASDIFLRDRTSGTLELISVSSSGTQADKTSSAPAITPDGRYVAFHSQAENLIPVDTNTSAHDIYIRDRQLGTTELVSIDSTGQQQPGENLRPAISNDAQIIVFETMSAFDPSDTNNNWDIYVRDRQSGVTTRISTAHDGSNSNGKSIQASLSGDGRYVVYESTATNLVAAGANGNWHVYLHDRQLGTTQKLVWGVNAKLSNNGCCIAYRGLNFNTWKWDIYHYTIATQQSELISQSSAGDFANNSSDQLGISGDGQHVVFTSSASNLAPGDTNGMVDAFVRNRVEATTTRISTNLFNIAGDNHTISIPAINTTGNVMALSSKATNLVPADTNNVADIFVSTVINSGGSSSVFWMEMVGVVDDGYALTKTAASGWTSGAASLKMIPGDGAVEYTIEVLGSTLVGLSSDNSTTNYTDIDYAIYAHTDSRLRIYEGGVNRGTFSVYLVGDILRIERVGSTIHYLRNGSIIYTSNIPSTVPLLVDSSLFNTGASIVGARLEGNAYENFDRDGMPDDWELTYGLNPHDATDALIDSDTDGLTNFEEYQNGTNPIVWDTDGDGMSDGWELLHELNPLNAADALQDPDGDGVNNLNEFLQGSEPIYPYVTWLEQVGVSYDPHALTKTASGSWDNGGAASLRMIPGDGAAEYTIGSLARIMVGLSSDNSTTNYTDIDYALYTYSDGRLHIYEGGIVRGTFGTYQAGDILRVERIGSTIHYLKNGSSLYTSTIPSIEPLLVDTSLFDTGGSIVDVKLIGTSYENFDRDGMPDDWELTYGLNSHDATDALIDSDADGLSNFEEYQNGTNPIVWDTDGDGMPDGWELLHELNPLNAADASQDPDGDGVNNLNEFLQGSEPIYPYITWIEQVGVSYDPHTLTKTAGGSWDNGGAASLRMITGDGSLEFTLTAASYFMAGLSSDNTSVSYTTIDYAIYVYTDGSLRVYEGGTNRGTVGTYQVGDVISVERVASTIYYMRNGVVLYTSTIPSTGPMLADVSLYLPGTAMSDAKLIGDKFEDANRDGLPD